MGGAWCSDGVHAPPNVGMLGGMLEGDNSYVGMLFRVSGLLIFYYHIL